MDRYIKDKSTGSICYSAPEEDFTEQAVEEMLVRLNRPMSDFEVGVTTFDKIKEMNAKHCSDNMSYTQKRKESYPPATDYLDGVVKGDQGQIDQYVSDCLAVKQRFPK